MSEYSQRLPLIKFVFVVIVKNALQDGHDDVSGAARYKMLLETICMPYSICVYTLKHEHVKLNYGYGLRRQFLMIWGAYNLSC